MFVLKLSCIQKILDYKIVKERFKSHANIEWRIGDLRRLPSSLLAYPLAAIYKVGSKQQDHTFLCLKVVSNVPLKKWQFMVLCVFLQGKSGYQKKAK